MKNQALVLALAACGLTAAFSVSAQERVRIGFMSPVTGPQAANGIDNRDGALLAISQDADLRNRCSMRIRQATASRHPNTAKPNPAAHTVSLWSCGVAQ